MPFGNSASFNSNCDSTIRLPLGLNSIKISNDPSARTQTVIRVIGGIRDTKGIKGTRGTRGIRHTEGIRYEGY